MKVLNLVTNSDASFYNNQINVLSKMGVETSSIDVPNKRPRSIKDYLSFYSKVIYNSWSNYDLVHANFGLTAPFAIAQPHRPIVLTLWGSDLMAGGKASKITKKLLTFFDEIIIPSKRMESYLPDHDYTIIPFGIDTDLFSPMSKRKAREKLGWNNEKPIVLFPYNPNRKIKNYNLARKVVDSLSFDVDLKITPGVSHDKMPYYYNASDAVLITSKREAGPMVVKEAALCNVPVVSTDVGFVKEVLEGISNSFVCTSTEELRKKLGYTLEENERSDGRKKLKEEASLEKMGERIIKVYKKVLNV